MSGPLLLIKIELYRIYFALSEKDVGKDTNVFINEYTKISAWPFSFLKYTGVAKKL